MGAAQQGLATEAEEGHPAPGGGEAESGGGPLAVAAIPVGIRWGLWLAGSGLPTKDSGFGLPLRGPGGVLGGMVAGVAKCHSTLLSLQGAEANLIPALV